MLDPRENAGRRKHSRGYLPHFDVYETTQFVTFRLADSMPQEVLNKWKAELESGQTTDVELRKRIEQYLDSGYGSYALRDPRIANLLRETLLKWDGERFELIAVGDNAKPRSHSDPASRREFVVRDNAFDQVLHCSPGAQDS